MRKIIVGAMVSIDGVMQAPGGPTEDPTNGFKFGGWVMPYNDQTFGEELDRLFASRVSQTGVIVGHYERGGEIKIGDAAGDSTSDREVARRERMKRENSSAHS